MKINKNIKGFAIIEILIGIFIFTMGLLSIYLLISGSLNLNLMNKNQLIAGNLSKEGIELIRNIRDSNYLKLHRWNQINLDDSTSDLFLTGSYYKIENNFSNVGPIIKVSKIRDFGEGVRELNGKMQEYRLCVDSNGRYTYDCSTYGNKKTHFYRYLKIDKVETSSGIISDAMKVTSKVIWVEKGYHELEIKTILTDWKKL